MPQANSFLGSLKDINRGAMLDNTYWNPREISSGLECTAREGADTWAGKSPGVPAQCWLSWHPWCWSLITEGQGVEFALQVYHCGWALHRHSSLWPIVGLCSSHCCKKMRFWWGVGATLNSLAGTEAMGLKLGPAENDFPCWRVASVVESTLLSTRIRAQFLAPVCSH